MKQIQNNKTQEKKKSAMQKSRDFCQIFVMLGKGMDLKICRKSIA